jgi:hypothetical protein
MKITHRLFSILIVLCMVFPFTFVTGASASSTAIFNSILDPLPGNLPSQPYQAQQATEVGDYIRFAGTERNLSSVTVTMSSWAKHSEYPLMPAAGFNHDLTLNIYNVDNSGLAPALGTLIKSVTKNFVMQWRPEADPTCPGGTAWKAENGNCYNGKAFNITFDLSSEGITLPDKIIYGIASNTQTYGNPPLGVPGPYNSLNFALNDISTPSVGTDVEPDSVFWNTITAGWYADGGVGGVGTFRRDTAWTPYVPAIRFDVTPTPGTSIVPVTDTATFCTGETSKVKINLTDVANLYGYQFVVNYDKTKVTATGAFVNTFFDTTGDYAPWNATCSDGTCKFSVSKLSPQMPVTGTGTVAEITFTGTNAGEFDVTVGNDGILSDRDANVIGHTVGAPLHLTVCGFATVSGVVSLQGRATPINAGTVTLTNGAFGPYTTNFDAVTGAWSISNVKVLPGGTNYTFDATHGLYLGNRMTHTLTAGSSYVAPNTKLKGGDADNSGLIDVSDITCISGSFGGAPATCGTTGSSDINADGLVNILDLVLPGGNYGLTTPQLW